MLNDNFGTDWFSFFPVTLILTELLVMGDTIICRWFMNQSCTAYSIVNVVFVKPLNLLIVDYNKFIGLLAL